MQRTFATVICACLVAVGTLSLEGSALGASAPRGRLTAQEYALLLRAQAQFKKALAGKSIKWKAALASCRGVGRSTTLMAAELADCTSNTALEEAFFQFQGLVTKCGTSALKEYRCALPLYAGLSRDANSFYSAEVSLRKVSVGRGFTGLCLATLGPTAAEVNQDHQFALVTSKLYKAVSELDVNQIKAEVKPFERLGVAILDRNPPAKLSVCPH